MRAISFRSFSTTVGPSLLHRGIRQHLTEQNLQRRYIASTIPVQAETITSNIGPDMVDTNTMARCDARLVIVAFGPDKPGIVARIGQVIRDAEGYVEIGKMTKLANFFCVMFEAAVPSSAIKSTTQAIKDMPDFEALIREAREEVAAPVKKTQQINITGGHRPGIVGALATALANLKINITDMKFYTEKAPFTEALIFKLQCKVTLPPRVTNKMVETEVMKVAEELDLDIWFEKPQQKF